MPTTEQLRSRLLKKLKELFQLDQPDLDFGFYRIMHAKSAEVLEFIDKDLLRIVADAFGEVDEARRSELMAAYEKAIQTAKEFGAPNPEDTEAVRKAKAALDAVRDSAGSEADIYDHLYRFFERYYDDGDFISRRYYTRETSGKAAPFAIPYNGEEVKLHWANADQYYVKTAEYFSNFTFDLTQTAEIRAMSPHERVLAMIPDFPVRVHFRVVDASEGEHGNVKASEQSKRFFIIHGEQPITCSDDGELVISFEYRPDPEKGGQEGSWRDKRNAEAVTVILASLHDLSKRDTRFQMHLRLLQTPAPTEKDAKRPLLAKYVNQYTARNTMDYFIHKDLGAFLRRELDFYIKNEVLQLDDIENGDAPAVESYLGKIRILRRIAGKLIDFLAQLEEFQKKLWLKKKFVVETNYCITLDRVPEELYPEIAANEEQVEEWVRLFSIDEIGQDLVSFRYSLPLTEDFLKANDKLIVDTRFFNNSFKDKIVASIERFDEQCEGVLIHSENFQALRLINERYRSQIKSIYIDPPYNSDSSPIIYKNSYKSSTWVSLMDDRVRNSRSFLRDDGVLIAAIDDVQQKELSFLLEIIFSKNILGTICVRSNPSGRPTQTGYSVSHEYLIFAGQSQQSTIGRLPPTQEQKARFNQIDGIGSFEWRNLRREGSNSDRNARRALYYPIYINGDSIRVPEMTWDNEQEIWRIREEPKQNEQVIYPDNDEGHQKTWRWEWKTVMSSLADLAVRKDRSGKDYVYYKRRPNDAGVVSVSSWFDAKYSSTEHGTAILSNIVGKNVFSYPKSLYAVSDAIYISGGARSNIVVLDYFAGSGTTGHSVINLNREDDGKRKYILIEMGDYFDTVLKPRIAKVVYSDKWKDGKPTARNTSISHCFKYLRLESYEDTLNNLRFDDNPARAKVVASSASLKEDYMLRYLLDVETRGSQSLLNIDAFVDPTAYNLSVKKPGSDEVVTRPLDLIETFNYLIGLRVLHMAAPQEFTAEFKRIDDPEVPKDQKTKLVVAGKITRINEQTGNDHSPVFWFRKVEGWVPKDPANPNNGQQEKVLIVWRKLTGDLEKDNLMLDEWFQKNRFSPRDFEFDIIYVNGSNNLPNLKREGETWKVRLIEEEFLKRMWDTEGV
jgi:adenine-specific DNA-methyltransferase